jgi:hypothetical protein
MSFKSISAENGKSLIRFCEQLDNDSNPFFKDGRSSSTTGTKKQSLADIISQLQLIDDIKIISISKVEIFLKELMESLPAVYEACSSEDKETFNYFDFLPIDKAVKGKSKEAISAQNLEKLQFNNEVRQSIKSIIVNRKKYFNDKNDERIKDLQQNGNDEKKANRLLGFAATGDLDNSSNLEVILDK